MPMRAMNLANVLVQKGQRVALWTSGFNHQQKIHRSRVTEFHLVGARTAKASHPPSDSNGLDGYCR